MELNAIRLADGCEKGLGIFSSLAQYFEPVNVVPKRNNVECEYRHTKTCGIYCPSHRTGFVGSHKICWQRKGKRM